MYVDHLLTGASLKDPIYRAICSLIIGIQVKCGKYTERYSPRLPHFDPFKRSLEALKRICGNRSEEECFEYSCTPSVLKEYAEYFLEMKKPIIPTIEWLKNEIVNYRKHESVIDSIVWLFLFEFFYPSEFETWKWVKENDVLIHDICEDFDDDIRYAWRDEDGYGHQSSCSDGTHSSSGYVGYKY